MTSNARHAKGIKDDFSDTIKWRVEFSICSFMCRLQFYWNRPSRARQSHLPPSDQMNKYRVLLLPDWHRRKSTRRPLARTNNTSTYINLPTFWSENETFWIGCTGSGLFNGRVVLVAFATRSGLKFNICLCVEFWLKTFKLTGQIWKCFRRCFALWRKLKRPWIGAFLRRISVSIHFRSIDKQFHCLSHFFVELHLVGCYV